jgi:glucose/arabinose dehydrogenase
MSPLSSTTSGSFWSLFRAPSLRRLLLVALVSLLPLPATVLAQDEVVVSEPLAFSLELVTDGLQQPVFLADPGDGTGRQFVVEQGGLIRILTDEGVLDQPFLDLSDEVSTGSEQGLLSMALHPDFSENGRFFIYYTDTTGDTQVARYEVSQDDTNLADPASATAVFSLDQPARNHNGGLVLFGPDGYLYIGLGDGGGQGDPEEHGQNPETLLGTILRIDVDNGDPYAIPNDNPFAQSGGALEIWDYGLRNPWRFSFDRETGDLYIADVGQWDYEEINFQPAGSDGGYNYGWNLAEGYACFAVPDCEEFPLEWPIFVYSHDFGCSVTGGYVVRDPALPDLEGTYLLADYCTGFLWGLTQDDNGEWVAEGPIETGLTVSSFAEDADGRVYLIDLGGEIYRIVS